MGLSVLRKFHARKAATSGSASINDERSPRTDPCSVPWSRDYVSTEIATLTACRAQINDDNGIDSSEVKYHSG